MKSLLLFSLGASRLQFFQLLFEIVLGFLAKLGGWPGSRPAGPIEIGPQVETCPTNAWALSRVLESASATLRTFLCLWGRLRRRICSPLHPPQRLPQRLCRWPVPPDRE